MIQMPGLEEPIKVETNTLLRVKQLKQLIKEKSQLGISVDRIQLQVEGGEVLKKNAAYLDEAGIRDNQLLILEIVDKANVSSANKQKK